MGYYCTVPQCTSLAGKTKNVKFHRFPRDVTMADKWNAILKRGKPYTKYSKVCSLHFTQADYNVTTMGQWKTLSKDAVPSQNLPKLHADGTVMVIRKSRTVKYREPKKEEICSEKDKWLVTPQHPGIPLVPAQESQMSGPESQEANINFRLQALSAIASAIPPHPAHAHAPPPPDAHKPRKQDAIMQTEPVRDDEVATDADSYPYPKSNDSYEQKKYDAPKDYTKSEEEFIPRTNEEYNSEAEKYALERKAHTQYDKQVEAYPKTVTMDSYPKMDMYPNFNEKAYSNRPESWYQNGYADSADLLRSQQHNLQLLQEQHRITENQNFFSEGHIKQEADAAADDDKMFYDRAKDHQEGAGVYAESRRALVKQEPDANGCENVMQPQGSPYYSNGHNPPGGYYGEARPGAELLIAKQNALAAHTQLWQNTMKRPFFYSETGHYSSPPLLHRYEDISRILQ